MSSYPSTSTESGAGLKLLAVFLGIVVCVMGFFGLWLALSAQHARDDARAAVEQKATAPSAHDHSQDAVAGDGTPSFTGTAPLNADALAMQHKAVPALLPPASDGPVANVRLSISHDVVSIAPGVKYQAWTFGGTLPGPVIHVRQGQTVKVTLVNDSPMPHSVDFHAARIAPNVAFSDVAGGESKTFSFKANDPGVYMYHCGTAPAFVHIANGMYGAIVVEPANMPKADVQYVLVSSELYLDAPGDKAPATMDLGKAQSVRPDWVVWNGYAAQYKTHPLTAKPGQVVRFWVVAAGPSLDPAFHVRGPVPH